MRRPLPILLAALCLHLPGPATAQSEEIRIEAPWARASIDTGRPGVAYMTLRNDGDNTVTVREVRTAIAVRPEIHASRTNADRVASMAPAGNIEIDPGERVALDPGGRHVMLMELQEPLVEGRPSISR